MFPISTRRAPVLLPYIVLVTLALAMVLGTPAHAVTRLAFNKALMSNKGDILRTGTLVSLYYEEVVDGNYAQVYASCGIDVPKGGTPEPWKYLRYSITHLSTGAVVNDGYQLAQLLEGESCQMDRHNASFHGEFDLLYDYYNSIIHTARIDAAWTTTGDKTCKKDQEEQYDGTRVQYTVCSTPAYARFTMLADTQLAVTGLTNDAFFEASKYRVK